MTKQGFVYSDSIGWYRCKNLSLKGATDDKGIETMKFYEASAQNYLRDKKQTAAVFFNGVDIIKISPLYRVTFEALVDIPKNTDIDCLSENIFKKAIHNRCWLIYFRDVDDMVISEDETGFLGFEFNGEVKDWTEKIQELNQKGGENYEREARSRN